MYNKLLYDYWRTKFSLPINKNDFIINIISVIKTQNYLLVIKLHSF